MFETRFREMQARPNTYITLVIEDLSQPTPPYGTATGSPSAPPTSPVATTGSSVPMGRIIAAATVIIEDKFVHSCSRIAHVEDVVVRTGYRGKNLGLK